MNDDINRRRFLRGSGVALALPLLEATAGRAFAADKAPRRMVAVNIPLGFHSPNFFPEESGTDYALSDYLQPAAALRGDFTVISGTSHPGVDGGHSAEKSFLSAAPHPGSRSFKNTISLDQLVARRIGGATRFASLTIGDHGMSWSANGVSIPTERSPAAVYARLFLVGSAKDVADRKKNLQDGRSVMDVVLDDANRMAKRAGKADRDKLDQYFTAVRETEKNLAKAEKWHETPKPKVSDTQPPQIASNDIVGRLRAHFDVVRLALMTDSTRVIALGGNGGSQVLPIKGVSMGYHGLTHHGKNPQMIQQLELIDRETMNAWAEFLSSLKSTPEGGGTLLGNTQVLLGSNLGNASGHLTTNLPIILAGGGFKHGRHLAFDQKNNYPLPNLFVSMLQGMGLDEDKFASSTGTMTGLV
jgi:hypothetical protein